MNLLVLCCIALLSGLLTFIMNWLALIPWRRAAGLHWSERARACHPARVSAASNLWVLPAVITIGAALLSPEDSPPWALTALVASIGTILGTIPMNRETCTRVTTAELWRQTAVNWIIRFLLWFVFLGAAALMPQEFNYQTILIALAVLFLLIWWTQSGWLIIGQWLGFMKPPPERLINIVKSTSVKMNVSVHEIWLLRSYAALAYALPPRRALLFSHRLLELLSDDEISAVSAHELAHLTEARTDYFKRYVAWLTFLPWIFVKPMIHTFDVAGFYLLLATAVLAPFISRRVSHKLEMRADRIAHAHEPDPGTYARALAKLYEDNLLPAVNAKKHATHPHLYDRLLAAGVTPDFPRPAPPAQMSWNGFLLSIALGIVGALLAFQTTHLFSFH